MGIHKNYLESVMLVVWGWTRNSAFLTRSQMMLISADLKTKL